MLIPANRFAGIDMRRCRSSEEETMAWTFEGYWNAVIGADRTVLEVIEEFGLNPGDRAGTDLWLGKAEANATIEGGSGYNVPPEFVEFHQHALDMLCAPAYGRRA